MTYPSSCISVGGSCTSRQKTRACFARCPVMQPCRRSIPGLQTIPVATLRATHGLMGMVQCAHPAEEADGWVVRLDGAAPGQRQGLRNHDAVQGVLLHHSHPAPDQCLQASWRTWGHAHTGVRSREGGMQRQHVRQALAPVSMPVMLSRACTTGITGACPRKGSCACATPLGMAREYRWRNRPQNGTPVSPHCSASRSGAAACCRLARLPAAAQAPGAFWAPCGRGV